MTGRRMCDRPGELPPRRSQIVSRQEPSRSVNAAVVPGSAAELVDALCGGIEYLTGPRRTLTTARLVLFVEAGHNADLRTALERGRAAMESAVLPALAVLGARDPRAAATAVMACVEGLILHRIARHDDSDPRPTLELVVHAALE